jgi:hypothetical protein
MKWPSNIDPAEVEACRAYARMMNNLDYRPFEPWLADDFHYASQCVLDEICSKAAYEAYIVTKLKMIQASGSRVWAELARFRAEPCVVLAQDRQDNLKATLLLRMQGGKVSRADLCIVPTPYECELSGELPK